MFQNYIKNIILNIIYFQLTVGASLVYATPPSIHAEQRTKQLIKNFMDSSTPSNMPFVEYLNQFIPERTQPLKRFNLSKYTGKQVYVGYGLYDADQKYCKYMEQPGLDPNHNANDRITTYFNLISSFNDHQYAISINKMSFRQCQDLANKFGLTVATPKSLAENGFLNGRFSVTNNGNKWLGVEKANCSENSKYMNPEGRVQEYFNWSEYGQNNTSCDPMKLKVAQDQFGTWIKQTGNEQNYCLVEADSPHINRPVKVCAPWWRVERDYRKQLQTTWGGVNIYRINQADIPAQSIVCTHMNVKALQKAESNMTRRVTCTNYYDATRASECLTDPMQPECYVDECKGYIENACVHVQEITPFKDYTKTQAIINGQLKWIKGKEHIRTEVYDCPAAPPSLTNSCLETSTVITYPKECPGSKCEALKECTYNAKTKEERQHCFATYPCKKIYGSPDLPVYNSEGRLIKLKGYCTNSKGQNIKPALEFNINIENKHDRKCLAYNTVTLTKHVNQNCTLSRPYTDHTVEMSLTGTDIYEHNPKCIRINNVLEARPLQQLTLNYTSNGFSRTVIKKAFINGKNVTEVNNGIGNYVKTPSEMEASQGISQKTANFSVKENNSTYNCSDISESWVNNTHTILSTDPESITSSAYNGSFSNSNLMKVRYNLPITAKASDCAKKAAAVPNATSHTFNKRTKVCNVYYPKVSDDKKFKFIRGNNPTTFISQTEDTKGECTRLATCIGGNYNKSSFSNGGSHICNISAGSNYSAPESPATLAPVSGPKECKPPTSRGSLQTNIDGNQDIFFIEGVVDGKFGYYSNYTTWPYVNNVVRYQNKQLFPIKPITQINDSLIYEGIFHQISILTKKPNILAGAVGGAAVGAVTVGLTALGATGIGIVVVVVFVVVAAIFGPKKKYNEQYNYWIIYKMVPIKRYVNNIYGYDYRIMDKTPSGKRKIFSTPQGNSYKLIYARFGNESHTKSFTGTLQPGNFRVMINNWFKQKKQLFMCYGWPTSSVPQIPVETGVVVGYPSCKWYVWNCDKQNSGNYSDTRNPLIKVMTNYYKGAVNTVSIVVPYVGDYEVKAYDKYNNLLGDVIVYGSQFISAAKNKASYAQAMFGLNMNLAAGIKEGDTTNACRYDLMTEWGGGVSGIYYEDNYTGLYHGCNKSNDTYVQDHSAVKLTIQSLGENKAFVMNLDKPLPWANRIFVVTLGKKEVRKYRCYGKFGKCKSSNYITTKGSK